jgi:hypothetical protein
MGQGVALMTPARQPQIFKAIKIEKPYEAIALIDGWLCIKYLDGGEESLSTFADVSKGDIIRFGHTTHTSPPAPEQGTSKLCFGTITLVAEECRKCNEIESCKQKQSILDYQKREIATEAAKAEREDALALLEEWDYHNNRNFGKPHPMFADMIRLVREKPDEIRKHLESLRESKEVKKS